MALPLFLSLVVSLPTAADSPKDSVPLSQARSSLEQGDTLGAIDILDEWASRNQAGQELKDLLGRLHFPDEPVDTQVVERGSPVPEVRTRNWRVRLDGGALAADPMCWDLGATVATRLREVSVGGVPAIVEGGATSMIWSTEGDPPDWAFEPLASITLQTGRWDLRLQGWGGIFMDEPDLGFLATGSLARGDAASSGPRWGGTVRWSLVSSSMAGVFGHWDFATGNWRANTRFDLRLRHDPVHQVVKNGSDSLAVQALRGQALARAMVLRQVGDWGFGPALELDGRTSFAADRWKDDTGAVRRKTRRDLSFSGGAVVRRSFRNGRWVEFRLGWTGASMDSRIDPTYSERNTGVTTSFASGLSF